MRAYYNEIDPYCVQWLRNLIDAGHISDGDVDDRDIRDVRPSDLAGYTQVHFFAGLGGWAEALRLADWPLDREVWTGSCPCQPFSAAGRREGFADERHLWPAFHHLIRERRPATVFGEQVASPDGYAWLDVVQTDLEAAAYACAAVVSPSAGYGAPHGRHRIYFVAHTHSQSAGRDGRSVSGKEAASEFGRQKLRRLFDRSRDGRATGELANTDKLIASEERQQRSRQLCGLGSDPQDSAGDASPLVNTDEPRPQGRGLRPGDGASQRTIGGPGPANGFWSDAEWLPCDDGKARSVRPGTFPLAHGVQARVGRLRAYGNAIVPQVAAAFIEASGLGT